MKSSSLKQKLGLGIGLPNNDRSGKSTQSTEVKTHVSQSLKCCENTTVRHKVGVQAEEVE